MASYRILGTEHDLVATATLTGDVFHHVQSFGLGAQEDDGGLVSFEAHVMGMAATASGFDVFATGGAGASATYTIVATNGTSPDTHTIPLGDPTAMYRSWDQDLGGTAVFTARCEWWWDYAGIDPPTIDADNGVLARDYDGRGRLYRRYTSETVSVVFESAGMTATKTGAAASVGGEVDYSARLILVCNAVANYQPGSPPVTPTRTTFDMGAVMTWNGLQVIGDQTLTDGGSQVDNLTGAHIHLETSEARSAYRGSVDTTIYPPKAFTVVGRFNAVDQPYPDPINVDFSRGQGDPAPTFTTGADWTRSGTQMRHTFHVELDRRAGTDGPLDQAPADVTVNQWQPLTPLVNSDWCRVAGEYTTYLTEDEEGHTAVHYANDDAILFHAWEMAGVTVALPQTRSIDPCNSLTGWTGAALASGNLHNSGAGAMGRTWSPFVHFGAYRYPRLSGSVSTGTVTPRLVVNGKTYTALSALTTSAGTVLFDLCVPDAAYTSDTTDTLWPDPNPTIDYSGGGSGAAETAGWGCDYVQSLSLSGWASGQTVTLTGLDLIRQDKTTAIVLGEWRPRWGDMILLWPVRTNDAGTTTEDRVRRGLVCDTDALKQALEIPDLKVTKQEGGGSGVVSYIDHWLTIAEAVDWINGTGPNSGGDTDPSLLYYQREPGGCVATQDAPDPDGSGTLSGDYLTSVRPFGGCWANGLFRNRSTHSWEHGCRLIVADDGETTSLSLPYQDLMTQFEWDPGAGDYFNYAPPGADTSQQRIFLPAHKQYRAQARGGIAAGPGAAATGKTVSLFPGPGEEQSSGTSVGDDTTDTTEGGYETSGVALVGYDTSGSGASTVTTANGGKVVDLTDGTRPSAVQTFWTRRVCRVILRVPTAPGRWLSADRSPTGRAARAWVLAAGTLQIDLSLDHDCTMWVGKTTSVTGERPCLRFDRMSATHRIWITFEATGGVWRSYSDDEGENWAMATTISGTGTFPTFCVTPTGAQHHYWVDAGAVKTKAVDVQGNTLVAARTVVASGVADDAITAWHNADTGNLFLEYRDGSGNIVTVKSSDDGLNFA